MLRDRINKRDKSITDIKDILGVEFGKMIKQKEINDINDKSTGSTKFMGLVLKLHCRLNSTEDMSAHWKEVNSLFASSVEIIP